MLSIGRGSFTSAFSKASLAEKYVGNLELESLVKMLGPLGLTHLGRDLLGIVGIYCEQIASSLKNHAGSLMIAPETFAPLYMSLQKTRLLEETVPKLIAIGYVVETRKLLYNLLCRDVILLNRNLHRISKAFSVSPGADYNKYKSLSVPQEARKQK